MSFDEFLKEKQKEAEASAFDREERINLFRQRIEDFYRQLKDDWLKDYFDTMHPVFKDITINEELLGAYTVRMLTLNVGHEKIDFKPIGTMLIGSPGRIDVTCGVRRARIVLTGEKARSPQDHIIVTMKGDKPVRRDYGKLVWKLVDMNGLMSFVDLTPQSVQDFIMDIAQ